MNGEDRIGSLAYITDGFKGFYPDSPPDLCPEGSLVNGSKNFRIIDGVLNAKYGYEKMQADAVEGIPLLFYKHTTIAGVEKLVLFTSTDIYYWDDENTVFKFLTQKWGTDDDSGDGTVTTGGDGNRTVTGTGTDWSASSGLAAGDYIGFNTEGEAAEPGQDDITTWYEIDSVDSDTQITLAEDGPALVSDTGYVTRKIYNAALPRRWRVASFYDATVDENFLIATNGSDAPVEWDGATDTKFEELGGSPPTADLVAVLGGRLIFGNVSAVTGTGTNTHYTLIWTPVADSDAWTGGGTDNASYEEMSRTSGEIMWLAPLGDYLVVGKRDCLILMRPTGDSDNPFEFDYVVMSEGSIVNEYGLTPKGIVYLSDDAFKLYTGADVVNIGGNKVNRTFFDNFSRTYRYSCCSAYAPRLEEWRLCVPSLDASTPDTTWVYRVREDEWAYDDVGFTAVGRYNYKEAATIDSLTDTIDSYTDPIDSWSAELAYEDIVMGDSDGYIYIERPALKALDGIDIECIAVTRDHVLGDLDSYSRVIQSYAHYKGTNNADDIVSCQLSVDVGDTYKAAQTFNNDEDGDRLRKGQGWNAVGRTARLMFTGRHMKMIAYKILYHIQGMR